jgi:hypothetical protein
LTFNGLHGVIFQKIELFIYEIVFAVKFETTGPLGRYIGGEQNNGNTEK